MLRVALRGVFARRLRAALTALAVFLGVALMCGTYVLTDTFNNSFGQIFSESNEGVDVAVVPKEVVETESGAEPPPLAAELLGEIQQVDGVAEAAGGLFSSGVTLIDDSGARIGSENAPAFGASTQPKRFDAFDYEEGRPPETADEVAIDKLSADNADLSVGDTVKVGGAVPARVYDIVGVAKLGEVDSFGGATVAILLPEEVQRLADKKDEFDTISVAAESGVSPEQLKRRIALVMPDNVEVRTGEENAEQQSADIEDDLGFLKTALLTFAWIALFVGAFTIFNTFSITVAQRTREFGMLRTLGASRRQVLGSVLIEAVVIGLLGAGAGILAGIGVASGLNSLFKSFGIDLPNTGNVIQTRTIVVCLIVGLVITLLAAIVPAIRATRISPMEALREHASEPTRGRRRLVTLIATVLSAAGLVAMCIGLFGGLESASQEASLLALGAALLFFGVALLSPRLVPPIAAAVGRPLERLRGLTGRLAKENAVRNPGRTATTAAALMIGLALVTFVSVFAAGISGSIDDAIDKSFVGDLTLQHQDGFSPIPAAAGKEVRGIDGVEAVSSIRFGEGEVEETGDKSFISSIDPEEVEKVLDIQWEDGSDETLKSMTQNDAVADKNFAVDNDLEVGDTVSVTTPAGREAVYTIRGTMEDTADLYGDFFVTHDAMAEDFSMRQESFVFANLDDGSDKEAVRDEIEKVVERDFPIVDVLDQEELKERTADQIDQLVSLLYALLSLAVIVSLFGIVNTLTLSIYERTRELGLLRAVGMSRRQVRTLVRYEAVITALIGAVMGIVVGVFFAVMISIPLADEGFKLVIPWATLLALFVLAALAGVLAAVLPARRAAKLDVLEALAYE
jgi:putative ABC transport system permease protein